MKMIAITLTLMLLPISTWAGNSKLTEVDLDEDTTQILKIDLDQEDLYYYADKTACVCWVANLDKQKTYAASIPCKNLKAHPKLKEHLEKCE